MDNVFTQLGVGGGFAVIILILVFKFLKAREPTEIKIECPNNIDHLSATMLSLEEKVERIELTNSELHRWHRPNDDGQQNWKWSSLMDAKFQKMVEGIDRLIQIGRAHV